MPNMNWFPNLHLESIFGNTPEDRGVPDISQQIPQQQEQTDQIFSIAKILMDRLNQPDPNVQRLEQLYNNFPVYEKPSIGRRLLAGIVGAGQGPAAGVAYRDEPYNKEVNAWKEKTGLAKDIAVAGSRENTVEMRNAISNIQAETARKKEQDIFDTKSKQLEQQLTIANSKIEQADRALAIRKDNIEAQNARFEAQLLAKGIEHQRDLLQKDKELAEERRVNTARISELEARAGKESNATNTPVVEKTAFQNKVQRMAVEHPEWMQYVEKDPNDGMMKLKPPTTGYFGGSFGAKGNAVEYEAVRKYLGSGNATPANSDNAKPNAAKAPVAPKGWKYVAKPGGGWTAVEDK